MARGPVIAKGLAHRTRIEEKGWLIRYGVERQMTQSQAYLIDQSLDFIFYMKKSN